MEAGEEFESNNCGKFTIALYEDSRHVMVKFTETGTELVVQAVQVRNGTINDPMFPRVHAIGFMGIGIYSSRCNTKTSKAYACWVGILRRCYDKSSKFFKRYGGRGITVHKDWHNFQKFAKWFYSNYRGGFAVDKDFRIPGSKEYSQDTCEFIPHAINCLLLANNESRGGNPVGVHYHKGLDKYQSSCRNATGDRHYLGTYSTPDQAFWVYKKYKEDYIKKQAIKYYAKGEISEQIYKSLMLWVIAPYPE